MAGISIFLGIVLLVFGILQIILFFKLWGMTNNVAAMKADLQTVVDFNYITCPTIEIRKKRCIEKMMEVFHLNCDVWEYQISQRKGIIDSTVEKIEGVLQRIIDKYDCSTVYSIDEFRKDLYDKYGVKDSIDVGAK